jgi:hypothetical protein
MKGYLLIIPLSLLVLGSSCVKNKVAATAKGGPAGRYGSEFPGRNATGEMERITRSVRKVYSVSTYTTYQFRREAKITGYDLSLELYKKAAWGVISTNETVFGTATIIGLLHSQVALLTCAHIVQSPDTLISYFEPAEGDPSRYIQSFSIKERQENWIKELSSCGPFMVLASDAQSDIALLGKKCENLADSVEVFPYPAGSARELGWGSFVYIFGFPMGNQVVTKGIVSPAAKRPMGEFSVDALLNKGFSGGIILAIRDGVPNFELVGMVKTVNSTRGQFLKPASDQQRIPDWMPYQGEAYVGFSENLQYGMNAVIPFEAILGFYKNNRSQLISGGYDLDRFFFAGRP